MWTVVPRINNQAECDLWYPELAVKQNVTCGTQN